jgi:hypothetical protein
MSEACIFSMWLIFLAENTVFKFIQAHPGIKYSFPKFNRLAFMIPEQIDHTKF